MVIKGSNRGGPAALAKHLQKDDNERVSVIGTSGLLAQDIEGALMELDALGTMLRTSKTLYHGSINPEPGERPLTAAEHDIARAAFLKGLGLENQPWIEIEHEKRGKDGVLRVHRHIVASAADLDHMRAINFSHNYRKHEEIARGLEREFGHERVQGAHVERFGIERPERTPPHEQMQRASRGGVGAKEAKALGAELWAATDSGKAIKAALESHGWRLARGDKERADGGAYFMAIDPQSEAHELRRMMPVKVAELYARMADVDAADLPSVREAKTRQQVRAADMEQRRAAAGRYDDIRPDTVARVFLRRREPRVRPYRHRNTGGRHQHPNRQTHAPRSLSANRHRPAMRPV